jgi:phage shock protein E
MVVVLLAIGCGGGTDDATTGIRQVSAERGADIQDAPPEDLVVLDVRTPQEFAEGHLDGAIMVDFYDADFADQLAELDPDVPYLLYCQSGNRSGQTTEIMKDLGFVDVAEIEGGILSWTEVGLPVVN